MPVIAFRSGGIPEVVDHGRTGFLVDSTREMAECAIALLTGDSSGLSDVSRAARDTWRSRFTRERFQRQLLTTLEKAASASRLPQAEFETAPPR